MATNIYSDFSIFFIHHWQLSLAFLIIAGVWIGFELRYTFNGVPKLTPKEAILLMNRESPIILDVRDITHFTKSHINGAMNIPLVDLNQGNGKLDKHKNQTVLLVCEQGMQAGMAAQTLLKQNFRKLVILKGGMQAWFAESLPVVKGHR